MLPTQGSTATHRCLRHGHPADDRAPGRCTRRVTEWSADTVDSAPLRELRLLSADLVPELLDLYLAVAPEQLSDLGAALTAADFERVRFCAHLLRGSCVNVGAIGLAALAEELERLGRNGSIVGGRALFDQLDAALPVVCSTLSRDRNQPGGLI